MFRPLVVTTSLIAVTCALAMQPAGQDMPPGHPQLPPGHPTPGEQAPPQADPADVQSIDAIVKAYYDVISGDKGVTRDWNRFRSLFAREARFIAIRTVQDHVSSMTLTPQQFIQFNESYFQSTGYFEQEIHREVDEFGHIAQVFSTYQSKHAAADPEPYSRGINSIQLMSNGERWWIVSIMWDYERPGENDVPAQYLPEPMNTAEEAGGE